jgi:hypothetical protein
LRPRGAGEPSAASFPRRGRAEGHSTYFQLANEAAHILRQSLGAPYRHEIVDEAQDLHPAQWRLVRAAVPPGPDDLFIVGDPHQRIYDNRVSFTSLGIQVRGRRRRLTLNYRTTQEILAWAVSLLGKAPDHRPGRSGGFPGRLLVAHARAAPRGAQQPDPGGRASRPGPAGARMARQGDRAARRRRGVQGLLPR